MTTAKDERSAAKAQFPSRKALALMGLGAIGAAAYFGVFATVPKHVVDIRPFNDQAEMWIASVADELPDQYQVDEARNWVPLTPGKHELSEGGYYFKLRVGEQERFGLIAVADNSPIILK